MENLNLFSLLLWQINLRQNDVLARTLKFKYFTPSMSKYDNTGHNRSFSGDHDLFYVVVKPVNIPPAH